MKPTTKIPNQNFNQSETVKKYLRVWRFQFKSSESENSNDGNLVSSGKSKYINRERIEENSLSENDDINESRASDKLKSRRSFSSEINFLF